MADHFNFTIEGIDELEKDLTEAIHEYPVTMKEGLRDIAKDFKKSVMAKVKDGKYHKGADSARIRKKFGIKTMEEGVAYLALVYNSARHFHLVERGHNKYDFHGNPTGGWVDGKFYMEKTKNEYEDIVPQRLEKLCDEVLRGHDL